MAFNPRVSDSSESVTYSVLGLRASWSTTNPRQHNEQYWGMPDDEDDVVNADTDAPIDLQSAQSGPFGAGAQTSTAFVEGNEDSLLVEQPENLPNLSFVCAPPSAQANLGSQLCGVPLVKTQHLPRLSSVEIGTGTDIGQGGNRGSRVYRLYPEELQTRVAHSTYAIICRAEAQKVYPQPIAPEERLFSEAVVSIRDYVRRHSAAMHRPIAAGFRHLILPEAFVTHDQADQGLLMPLYDISLREFLCCSTERRDTNADGAGGCNDGEGYNGSAAGTAACEAELCEADGSNGVFCSTMTFAPIRSTQVILAIVYQLLQAVALLNENLPHLVKQRSPFTTTTAGNGRKRKALTQDSSLVSLCQGYTHNDIHLDNIMLIKATGNVALCDFELICDNPSCGGVSKSSSTAAEGTTTASGAVVAAPVVGTMMIQEQENTNYSADHYKSKRLPPLCRMCPGGINSAFSDTWAIGLIVVNLLTGVDPIFDNNELLNDFGSGPLLLPHDDTALGPGMTVLDWEANIKAHVLTLLKRHEIPETPERSALLDLCSHCLVNVKGRTPLLASQLLALPLFDAFRREEGLAEETVRQWIYVR